MTNDRQLTEPTRRILTAMVWLESGRIPMPWHRSLVAYASDHKPGCGAFRSGIAHLRRANLLGAQAGRLVIEHGGRLVAEEPPEMFTRDRYWGRLYPKLTPIARAICSQYLAGPGISYGRKDLAAAVGIAPGIVTFGNAIGKLLAARLIEVEQNRYVATEVLWPLNVFERRNAKTPAPAGPTDRSPT